MIAKILEHRPVFKGVGYNTKKIDKQTGELMLVQNFGALQGLSNVTRQVYMSYLQTWSSASGHIRKAQFHAVISAKGQESNKAELTAIATKWMDGMGYGQNPYLVVFHKDTENNHVHIVSSRVGPDGKKINDSFERVRSQQVLEQIMGTDRSKVWEADLNMALNYQFSSRAQFLLLMELKGYSFRAAEAHYEAFKGGEKLADVSFSAIDQKISGRVRDTDRIRQLKAVFSKYQDKYSTELKAVREPLPGDRQGRITGYTSAFSETLRSKFGIQLVFHASGDKPPYGYTIIDHAKTAVYKGGEIMPLKELLVSLPGQQELPEIKQVTKTDAERIREKETMTVPLPGMDDQNAESVYEPLDTDVPAAAEINEAAEDRGWCPEDSQVRSTGSGWFEHLRLDISPDIDDEQINGRNRRRKRKARTNTR